MTKHTSESALANGSDKKAKPAIDTTANGKLDLPWSDFQAEIDGNATLGVIGCGTLSSAILSGILTKWNANEGAHLSTITSSALGPKIPTRWILNCRSQASCERLEKTFSSTDSVQVSIAQTSNNVSVASASHYVLLGCKPYMVSAILGQSGMREALAGKLLISICAGVTVQDLETAVYGNFQPEGKERCRFLRVMPNTAARIRESMTVIESPTKPLPDSYLELTKELFSAVGKVVVLEAKMMDTSTALAGSGPAFCLLMLQGLVDGALAMGVPLKEATIMAAQTMKGAASMVAGGEGYEGMNPALLRDQVTTPGGCTMGGLIVLEDERVRGAISKAIRRTTVVASKLGSGAKNVNGVE